ncbi:hypothetical protein COLO4_20693 [Corchorus olitorius]|uniref:Uncharacterized protein n=1 Tax=Corchorus olitorius TaxID=93759 RepID=A0A1R3IXJ4_9ROSI|nr:hypothetical protein COLO4_20693 [Corchorus olitorius]
MEEVKAATFSMKDLKAPGADGIQSLFYQRNWEVVTQAYGDGVAYP